MLNQHCYSTALSHFQNIFPSLILPTFNPQQTSFIHALDVPIPLFSLSPTHSQYPLKPTCKQLSQPWDKSWTNSNINTNDP